MNIAAAAREDLTVYIVDDDNAVCDAIASLVECDNYAVRVFNNADDFLNYYKPSYRGCLVLDVRMPNISGIEVQTSLLKKSIDLPIIFISAHSNTSVASRVMKAGAVEFLTKPYDPQQLLESIHEAIKKDKKWHCERQLYDAYLKNLMKLSPREISVLQLLMTGLTSKEIGKELNISFNTVDVHRAKIFNKLQVTTIVELIRKTSDFLHTEEHIKERCSYFTSHHGLHVSGDIAMH